MTSGTYSDHIATLQGRDVYDPQGQKIGSVGQIYADRTGQPTWASVNTGLFGMKQSLVPLSGANVQDDRLLVAYDKATVKDAPHVDHEVDEPLTAEQVQHLYQHYNLGWDQNDTQDYAGGYTSGSRHAQDAYADGGDTGLTGGDAMTRSEERLDVDKRSEAAATARLRKYVVTENVQTTVPVQHEEVRLEREPVTGANRGDAYDGPDITESQHEVTLHAERPVVNTETVPVERVRLGKETVTDQQTVGGDVRKERIEADLPDEDGPRRLG